MHTRRKKTEHNFILGSSMEASNTTDTQDVNLVEVLFSERDWKLIISIALSDQIHPDCWYWDGDPNGEYTVKQGYRSQTRSNLAIMPNSDSVDWKRLWNLQVPAKVKCFLWCIFSGSLPLNPKLAAMHVDVLLTCPNCNIAEEFEFHAFIDCVQVRKIWAVSCFGDVSSFANSFLDWWNAVCNRFKIKDICVIAMILWAIWNQRNHWVWNEKRKPEVLVIGDALNLLSQWRIAQRNLLPTSNQLSEEGAIK
ncbi:hypothetical protein LguiA_024005 [Lonicera macranthoides]